MPPWPARLDAKRLLPGPLRLWPGRPKRSPQRPGGASRGNRGWRWCGLLLIGLALGGRVGAEGTGPLGIMVSLPPLVEVVQAVGGAGVEVHALLRPGDNHHLYDPPPGQVARLRRARLFLGLGLPFEGAVVRRLDAPPGEFLYRDLAEGLERLTGPGHDHASCAGEHAPPTEDPAQGEAGDDSHHHADHPEGLAGDPHVWLSARRTAGLARAAAAALAEVDPDGAAGYRARAERYAAACLDLDRDLAQLLAPYRGQAVYVYHAAFAYFCADYGLRQVAVEEGQRETTPRRLEALIRQARADGVRAIYVQPQYSPHSARALAQAVGARLEILDPLAPDHLANLRRLGDSLAAGSPPIP